MDAQNRPLAWSAYGVALLLIVIPLADSSLGVMPFRFDSSTWRFGAVGLVSRALMTPIFGLLVAITTAAVFRHRRAARAFAVLAFLGATGTLVAVVAFGLDAIQTRAQVKSEAAGAFDLASGLALAKYLAGCAVLTLLGFAGWKAGRRPSPGEAAPVAAGQSRSPRILGAPGS